MDKTPFPYVLVALTFIAAYLALTFDGGWVRVGAGVSALFLAAVAVAQVVRDDDRG